MAASMLVKAMFGGSFGCLNTAVNNTWTVLNDAVSATALPVYATGEALEVNSSNPTDGAANLGARTATVIYINNDGTVGSEVVSITGGGNTALTDTTISRVLDFYISSYGGNGVSAGTLTVRRITGSVNRCQILAGRSRAATGRFTIPEGFIGVYKGFNLSCTSASASAPVKIDYEIEAEINPLTGAYNAGVFTTIDWACAGPTTGIAGCAPADQSGGRKIYLPAKSTIHARAKTDTAGTITVAGFVYIDLIVNGEV